MPCVPLPAGQDLRGAEIVTDRSTVDGLADAFIARTLPKAEWTHHAHLKVGLWHALRHPSDVDGTDGVACESNRSADPALGLLRERISRYNEATGVPNTPSGGYHETITRFYLIIIRRFLATVDRSRGLDDLAAELIARFGERELPLRYYRRERLFSTAARAGWLPPDTAV